MSIDEIFWLDEIIDKLAAKHNVDVWEVEEVFLNLPRFRLRQQGRREGENLYSASGQTDAGRYLIVLSIYKPAREDRPVSQALVVSTRDMDSKERKQYERK